MTPELFIKCITMWWDPSYASWIYFALFLPVVLILYQAAGEKHRSKVLLLASWFYFITLSGWLFLIHILEVIWTWFMALQIQKISDNKEYKRKEKKKRKLRVLVTGILSLLLVLFILKYLDFMGLNIVRVTQILHIPFDWKMLNLAIPLGISYYTLEAISYLTDVYREDIKADPAIDHIALYMGFFPKIVEGPITRYGDDAVSLFSGRGISYENLTLGYQRIFLGVFKKLMIADHLAPAVDSVYKWHEKCGSVALFGAVIFTVQEYMDFSGSIDIVIGSARIFGIELAENFKQPFFAKNASDFWHRWHITLGTFFRDYIFYPVSVSKPVMKLTKKIKNIFGKTVSHFAGPTIAIFCVWISNGLWHGPKWTYIFYGIYYFTLIFIENIIEKPFLNLLTKLKLTEESRCVRIFRFIKLTFIVIIGEMFFRADTLETGFEMFRMIFVKFKPHKLIKHFGSFGLDRYDYWTVLISFIVIVIYGIIKESGYPLREKFEALPRWMRWSMWYAMLIIVILFGAYGSGYDKAGMIYAKF
ncbi:D-alanyl-lipoteichoic acid acyltransferase DltB, MBOAT superfamily [Lachnospiraceae bacterium]|nr:D-alanyl-lipoteichoic acid acyltransferase DltB, MBOAT superfamily [Lachnospiraceae bacterium]